MMLKRVLRFWTWLPLLGIILVSLPVLPGPQFACPAHAALITWTDFCYRSKITIQNQSGGTLAAGYPVGVDINVGHLIDNGYLDASIGGDRYGMDLRPVSSSLDPIEVVAQDLDQNPARWWVKLPDSVANNDSISLYFYMGNEYANRNNSFYFYGSDTITVTDHADFDFTDHFELITTVETDDPTQNAWFVTKYDAVTSQGFRFGVIDDTGTSKFRGVVDNQTLDATYGTGWDGSELKVRMTFDAPTLNIDYWDDSAETWTNIGTLNTGLSGVTATAEDMVFGSSYTGMIREVEVRDNFNQASYGIVARWGMLAEGMTETSASDPTYQGTVQNDLNPGTHDGTYSLSRSQSGITVSVGPLALGMSESPITFTEQMQQVMGTPVAADIFSEETRLQRIPFYTMLNNAASASGMTDTAFWGLVTFSVGFFLALAVWAITGGRHAELAAACIPAAFLVGGLIGLYEAYIAAIAGFAVLAVVLLPFFRRQMG